MLNNTFNTDDSGRHVCVPQYRKYNKSSFYFLLPRNYFRNIIGQKTNKITVN